MEKPKQNVRTKRDPDEQPSLSHHNKEKRDTEKKTPPEMQDKDIDEDPVLDEEDLEKNHLSDEEADNIDWEPS